LLEEAKDDPREGRQWNVSGLFIWRRMEEVAGFAGRIVDERMGDDKDGAQKGDLCGRDFTSLTWEQIGYGVPRESVIYRGQGVRSPGGMSLEKSISRNSGASLC